MKSKLIRPDRRILFAMVFIFAIFSSFLIILTAARFNWDKSLILLSAQFLKGHISLEPIGTLPLGDLAIYKGKFYLYFGLFPSLVLMPFTAMFGRNFPQIFLGILSMFLSFAGIYSISRVFKFDKLDSLFLSLFFVFSTVLFSSSLINITAYQVEAFAVPLVIFSLERYFRKRSMFLSGLFLGLAVLTRFTLIMAVVFFVTEFLKKRVSRNEFIKFLIPLSGCCLTFALYNFIRFHSPLETGYNHIMPAPFPLSKNLEYGTLSLIHIPANLYSFLIMPPDTILYYSKGFVLKFPYLRANPWGMAIWYTSPLFLFLFRFKKWKYTLPAALATILLAVPNFTYFSVGFAQFGYRYALDFMPFLFLLLIPNLIPKLSNLAIFLIITGVLFNCIYITSLWGVYPIFGI